jgi:hypothetical protein
VVPFQPFHLNYHERGQDQVFTHHLYLQARIEHGSAYMLYINIRFSRVLFENDQSLCSNYRKVCPVNSDKKSKIIEEGYHTDFKFMRLLFLKKWLSNVDPAEEANLLTVSPSTVVWNAFGLSDNEYLSSALAPPTESAQTKKFTNSAYLQLLKCGLNLASYPFLFSTPMLGLEVAKVPVDRTVSHKQRQNALTKMISCPNPIPTNIQRLLFLSLKVTLADTKLDAFDAIAASMYLEGNLGIDEDGDFPYQQMSLELRLNVSAFYQRCLRYPLTSTTLIKWAILVVQEYDHLVNNNSVAQMRMSNFNPHPSFPNDRRAWSANFNLLALRLTNTDILGPKPPLWADIYVLQLLFAEQDPPVFIAPVYGCIYQPPKKLSRAFPLVPSFSAVTSF